MEILELYHKLYNHYGPQGWWPLLRCGYHHQEYCLTLSQEDIFEVALGSILTQNTTFVAVEKSLNNLKNINALSSHAIKNLSIDIFKIAIKPSGYFNQKADYILNFIDFFHKLDGKTPTRDELLKIKGIGEETADSILLYGYAEDEFKIDAYTKRILIDIKLISEKAKYGEMKKLFEDYFIDLIKDKQERVKIYQEFHSLFVVHGKKYYSKKPYRLNDFL